MSLPTPNYVTNSTYTWGSGHDTRTLPAGSFVRPIEERWLPKHVLEDNQWRWLNKSEHVFAYCFYGIICIPTNFIRKV